MRESQIREKAYKFALSIIKLYRFLLKENEYVLSKQLLRSGTSIGANVEEALAGQSRLDFLSKMSIASKEARKSNYWLRLLKDSSLIEDKYLDKPITDSEELVRMLTAAVKTTSETKKLNAKVQSKN
jgi:four helix bundle protein